MIVFDTTKKKRIQMVVESEGINPSKLDFVFRIVVENVEYGFPCSYAGGKVNIEIPPLSEVVLKTIEPGNYQAKLEVSGDNKYYLKPFNEQVLIKLAPKLDVSVEDESDNEGISENVNVIVSKLFVKDEDGEVNEEDTEDIDAKVEKIKQIFANKK